jgi:membrane fusion protein (multidrug efflux system)
MSTAKHAANDPVIETANSPSPGVGPAPRARRSPLRPYLALGAVVLVGLAGALTVRILTAGRQSTDDAQVSADMVPVSVRVGGVVVTVPVSDNMAVKRGDLLAQLDPTDYENKVKQAEAELRAAQAQASAAQTQTRIVAASSKGGLSTARAALSGTAASVAGADAQVGAARAMLTKAEADAGNTDNELRRAEALRKGGAIPEAQVDALKSQAAMMHAAVAQARAQVAVAEEGKNSARLRIAEAAGRVEQNTPVDAQVDVAKANAELAAARAAMAEVALAQARLNLSYTKVLAPQDGHISKLAAHAGQLLQPAQVVTTLLPDATYVVANFKETQVGQMRPGQPAEISLDAFPGRTFHARVESVAFGTGAQFSMLPPDNASGNFVKVVQRVPVKLAWTELPPDVQLAAGLSADVTVLRK